MPGSRASSIPVTSGGRFMGVLLITAGQLLHNLDNPIELVAVRQTGEEDQFIHSQAGKAGGISPLRPRQNDVAAYAGYCGRQTKSDLHVLLHEFLLSLFDYSCRNRLVDVQRDRNFE